MMVMGSRTMARGGVAGESNGDDGDYSHVHNVTRMGGWRR